MHIYDIKMTSEINEEESRPPEKKLNLLMHNCDCKVQSLK